MVTALVSGIVTVAFALMPWPHLGYRWPSARIAVETSGALVALFATFLVFGRLRRRTYLNELFLASALALLAIPGLLIVAGPAVARWGLGDLTAWGAPQARWPGAVLFMAAAFIPRRGVRRTRLAVTLAAVVITTAIGLAIVFTHLFAGRWAPGYPAALTAEAVVQPGLRAYPVLLTFELLLALLYILAAIGFLHRCRGLGDAFCGWLAAAAILAAVSPINYSLFPASYSQSVLYPGDVFRFAFYVALLLGCLREVRSYWTAPSGTAVLDDRRRIACDLHDGLAQELAYISRNLDLITGEVNRQALRRLRPAVERAQAELRSAISALAPPRHQDAEIALAEAAAEVADRFRIELKLDLVPGIRLSPTRTEALIRIACEAVTNAARHSGARSVTVCLERDASQVRLQVVDRGCGFDTAAPRSGFGLVCMQERAQSVGGELRICSVPGRGSEVDFAV